ncbi:hypothetical protein TrLO_g2055 [Triparma laevis f. longispina]|uniref:Dynamin-type G domain-containing protein n=1 Tax=Triparma laevis f. longispina TaxID=1714387 RepID=A0A9W7KRQ8_9STRA|nr:hypothetical protein TrLO_g2055 [Triparma laevis f. longispina]
MPPRNSNITLALILYICATCSSASLFGVRLNSINRVSKNIMNSIPTAVTLPFNPLLTRGGADKFDNPNNAETKSDEQDDQPLPPSSDEEEGGAEDGSNNSTPNPVELPTVDWTAAGVPPLQSPQSPSIQTNPNAPPNAPLNTQQQHQQMVNVALNTPPGAPNAPHNPHTPPPSYPPPPQQQSSQQQPPQQQRNPYNNNGYSPLPNNNNYRQPPPQYGNGNNNGNYNRGPPRPYGGPVQQRPPMPNQQQRPPPNSPQSPLAPNTNRRPPPQLPTSSTTPSSPSPQSPSPQSPSPNIIPDPSPVPNLSSSSSSEVDLSQFDKDVIFSGLKKMYKKKIRPLEISSKYGHFHSPPLGPSDFDAKPMVLLLGGYSVGKTSLIRYLLGRDFPGQRIGPEPTTDRFTCIMDNEQERVVPGAALAAQADRPFRGLSPFGNNFLSRLEGVEMSSPILKNITLVDTPGILSGEKVRSRNYDYENVMKWFAERADLIIIVFDAHKLDISDELKRVIELMKPHSDKVRVLLNKADMVDAQQLMRVYGALMWSLGKVMLTPEVCRVYIGSFWEKPLQNTEQASLLMSEKNDLFHDIAMLPQNAVMRRINELVKRARSVKVHAYIIHYLRKQLPYTWGKRDKQRRLIDRLDREFVMCARRYELPKGDFPPLAPFKAALLEVKDLSSFQKLDKRMVKEMDKVFSVDIPELLQKARQG